jgi:putative transposase
MTLFRNRYRIESNRYSKWDYCSNASYFITIKTQFNYPYFGYIKSKNNLLIMHLSSIGQIVLDEWYKLPQYFPFIKLGEFAVLPNHIHGIITVHNHSNDKKLNRRDAINRVSTENTGNTGNTENTNDTNKTIDSDKSFKTDKTKNESKQNGGVTGSNNPMNSNCLGKIIRRYKGAVTYLARK